MVIKMQVIIQAKNWQLKDIKIAKLIKWYQDNNRVHVLNSPKKIYEFLYDIALDDSHLYSNYENIIKNPYKNISLNDIYYQFLKQSDNIPLLYIATYKNGHYKHIEKLNVVTLSEMVKEVTGDKNE